jgi:uncharacterized protein
MLQFLMKTTEFCAGDQTGGDTNLQENMGCGTFSKHRQSAPTQYATNEDSFTMRKLVLHMLGETFTINKLPQFAEIPSILSQGEMCFIFRTDEELSIICPDYMAPNNVQQELGWRCFKVEGAMKLQDVGVLAAISQPLAEANIPMFAVSTFNTDYVFVMDENLVNAVQALQKAGHTFLHKET